MRSYADFVFLHGLLQFLLTVSCYSTKGQALINDLQVGRCYICVERCSAITQGIHSNAIVTVVSLVKVNTYSIRKSELLNFSLVLSGYCG